MPDDFVRLHFFSVDGRSVRCRILEPAPDPAPGSPRLPLLLLHGLGCSMESWLPAMKVLSERRPAARVHAADFPGFGCSPGPREAMGMEDLADWAARLLDAMGVARAHLAGNSMGCQVALALARRHPERVGGLVLIGPTSGDRLISFWRYALGLLLDGAREPMRYNAVLTGWYLEMGVPRYLTTTRKMLEDDPVARAGEVAAPCLVVRGGYDGIIPDAAARRLAAALPRSRFERLPKMPHALQYSRPREMMDVALPFWAEAEAALSSPLA